MTVRDETPKAPRRRRSSVMNVRIDSADKARADAVMSCLGVTPTEVIRLLYRQISLRGRLPFEVALPPEKLTAIEAVERSETYDFKMEELSCQPNRQI